MRYWFDTEFDERGPIIHLISIGIVAEDGREYYAICADYDEAGANDWLKQNVLPHIAGLPRISRARIRGEVLAFFNPAPTEIWAYFGEYDWIVLRQLVGHMIEWPFGWPLSHMNLAQLMAHYCNPLLPAQPPHTVHDALNDARWCRDAWYALTKKT